jgi:tetratricopeptide (TPR) repeat protein
MDFTFQKIKHYFRILFMNILTASILLSLSMWVSPAYSQTNQRDNSPSDTFSSALQSFKTKDYVQSRKLFENLIAQHPNDTALLYNLGLVEAMDNHPARAFAYWRKALFLSPGDGPSLQGIARIKDSVDYPSPLMPLYWRIPIAWMFILSALAWLLSGFLILFSLRRRKNKQSPIWGSVIASCVVFIILSSLSLHNYWLSFERTSGTVMAATPAFASPQKDAASLFDFREGDEVQILRSQGQWAHVQKSATAVGWVQKQSILRHSGL